MKRFIFWLRFKYWSFVLRDMDPNVCCCGDWMDHAYDNHMPRSAKEYAIFCMMKKEKP